MDEEQSKADDPSPSAPDSAQEVAGQEASGQEASGQEAIGQEAQTSSPWESLAKELGAEPSPNAMERPQLESTPPHLASDITENPDTPGGQDLGSSPEPLNAPEPSPKSGAFESGGWDDLASSLGLADSQEETSAQELRESPRTDSPRASNPQETVDSTTKPSSFSAPNASHTSNTNNISPSDQDASPPAQESVTSQDEKEEDEPIESWGNRDTLSEEEQSQIEFAEELDSPPVNLEDEGETDASDGKGLSGKVAQSVFDALFLSGSTAAEALGNLFSSEKSGTDEPGDENPEQQIETDKPGKPDERSELDERGQPDEQNLSDKMAGENTNAAGEPLDQPEEQTKSKTRRRRPRRRRGRGRGVATRETDRQATSSFADEDSPSTEASHQDKAATSKRSMNAPSDKLDQSDTSKTEEFSEADDIPLQDVSEQTEDNEEILLNKNAGGPSKRPTHRNIPSWKEAMGVIVDRNIEERKNSPSPSSRSGASRGRSRGGRRRKKS